MDDEDIALQSFARLATSLLTRNDTSVILGPVKTPAIKQVQYVTRMHEVKVRRPFQHSSVNRWNDALRSGLRQSAANTGAVGVPGRPILSD